MPNNKQWNFKFTNLKSWKTWEHSTSILSSWWCFPEPLRPWRRRNVLPSRRHFSSMSRTRPRWRWNVSLYYSPCWEDLLDLQWTVLSSMWTERGTWNVERGMGLTSQHCTPRPCRTDWFHCRKPQSSRPRPPAGTHVPGCWLESIVSQLDFSDVEAALLSIDLVWDLAAKRDPRSCKQEHDDLSFHF